MEMPPELELLMMLFSSAFMFHISHTFMKSFIPQANFKMQNIQPQPQNMQPQPQSMQPQPDNLNQASPMAQWCSHQPAVISEASSDEDEDTIDSNAHTGLHSVNTDGTGDEEDEEDEDNRQDIDEDDNDV